MHVKSHDNPDRPYRHELKYVCTDAQLMVLESKIRNIMTLDRHTNGSHQYNIRSIYFDDYLNSAFFDNENGVDNREKFRIRVYNRNSARINLELKRKQWDKTQKLHCLLTADQCKTLMSGKIVEHDTEYPLPLHKLYLLMRTRLMRPRIIVEYDRTPYVYADGNVRVTFDRNIGSSNRLELFFDKRLPVRPIMPVGQHILEVKWDEYLPDFIYRSLQLENLQRTSFSKYYLSRKLPLYGGNCYEFY